MGVLTRVRGFLCDAYLGLCVLVYMSVCVFGFMWFCLCIGTRTHACMCSRWSSSSDAVRITNKNWMTVFMR